MSHDTIVHRTVRPVVRLLARTRVTPNQLTVLRFATALTAAAAFAQGGAEWNDIGAAVFLLSAFLDRADGELARLTRRFSQHGHRFDLLADWSANAMIFIGLGLGGIGTWLGPAAPVLGVLAAIGVSALFWGPAAARLQLLLGSNGRNGRVLVDPDDAMLAVPVLLWLFGSPAVLIPAGTITPVLAFWLAMRR